MTRAEATAIATRIAWSYHGTFYSWGGDDPSGFDCSGLVIEILKSVGILGRTGDWTADGLARLFSRCQVSEPSEGCLVFWWGHGKALHVEYCINSELSIGASGGGSSTRTKEDAIRNNAFVKVRPIDRGGAATFVNPFLRMEE